MLKKRFCISIFSIFIYSIAFVAVSYKSSLAKPVNIIIEGPGEAGKVCINIKDAPTEICKYEI
jgi:hypothetical protein